MTSSSWDIQAQMETLPPTTRSGPPFISNPVYRWMEWGTNHKGKNQFILRMRRLRH